MENIDFAKITLDELMKASLKRKGTNIDTQLMLSNDNAFKYHCKILIQDITSLIQHLSSHVTSNDQHNYQLNKLNYAIHTIKLISIIYSENPQYQGFLL